MSSWQVQCCSMRYFMRQENLGSRRLTNVSGVVCSLSNMLFLHLFHVPHGMVLNCTLWTRCRRAISMCLAMHS